MENLMERIETLVFLSKELLSVEEIAKFYEMEVEKVTETLEILKEKRKESGINVKIENGIISLVSNPMYGEDVYRFFSPEMKLKKLSKSSMETLAIIAYKGPITKGEIEQIRGVGVEKVMSTLMEKNLIYISGKKKSIGTPNLYEVTEDFYSYLGVRDNSELPGYSEFKDIKLKYKTLEEDSEDNLENLKSIEEKIEKKIEVEKNEIE